MNDAEFHIRIQAALPDGLTIIEIIDPILIENIEGIPIPGIEGRHGRFLHALQIEGKLSLLGQGFLLCHRFQINHCFLDGRPGRLVHCQIIQPEIIQGIPGKPELVGTLHCGMFHIVSNGEETAVAAAPGKHAGNRQIRVFQVFHAHVFQPKISIVIGVIHPLRDGIGSNSADCAVPFQKGNAAVRLHPVVKVSRRHFQNLVGHIHHLNCFFLANADAVQNGRHDLGLHRQLVKPQVINPAFIEVEIVRIQNGSFLSLRHIAEKLQNNHIAGHTLCPIPQGFILPLRQIEFLEPVPVVPIPVVRVETLRNPVCVYTADDAFAIGKFPIGYI